MLLPKKRSSGGTFQLVDNRPETVQLQKLQEMLANSQLGKTAELPGVVQKKGPLDEEELQLKAEEPVQKKDNNTGLPDNLKSGIETLSGYSMDDVNVHYHSDKPAQLQAHAYTQGADIHIALGQEKHLPHEA